MKQKTPQSLCVEIEKHEKFLALADAGLVKISKRKRDRHAKYIDELKRDLYEITADSGTDCDLTDDELLAELTQIN